MWHESGEQNTRYFYNLEKQNYEKKTMTKLNAQMVHLQVISFRFCENKWIIIKDYTPLISSLKT